MSGIIQVMFSRSRLANFVRISLVVFPVLGSRPLIAAPIVAFDSFGPGNTYTTTVAWGVTGAATPGGYRGQAEWFVPTVSGTLSSIDLAVFRQSGSGRLNYFIAEDNGSGSPGTSLEN